MPIAARQEQHKGLRTISPGSINELRDWTPRIDGMRRSGELRVRTRRDDSLVRGRMHERLDQYHRGVRVFGADVAEQLNGGQVMSAFGSIYEGIDVDTSPAIDADRVREIVETRTGSPLRGDPELVVLPRDSGDYALAWRASSSIKSDLREYFVDAQSGSILLEYSNRQTQSAVGTARGVLGDTKKISVTSAGGNFIASDLLRPPSITTYDMRGDYLRTDNFVDGRLTLSNSDIASDSDNAWTDGAVGDAHVYAGWTYDFYFKQFNRRGLDNADRRMQILVHPIPRNDVFTLYDQYDVYYTNAFYAGNGIVVLGEGLPPNATLGGQNWDFTAGSLDLVAHELTHGVTDFSSRLIYLNESGALNEAFSDIMGTSVEFYYQGREGRPATDYAIAEDVVRPGGIRSMADPGAHGDPDHYSRRYTGQQDNGGVHINCGIPNHAFYLAIEGGTNRTSGQSVQGVGAANRNQIENVFYRAFTQMLPANATFAVARAATIQSARDLFGANSNAERAITQAWSAVGVN